MAIIEIEKRARVAAKRRNNRTRRELPLLDAQNAIPADMLTTPDAQAVRLEKQAESNEAYFAKLKLFDEQCAVEAERLREFCRSYLDRDGFMVLVSRARYTEHMGSVYRLDFWSREAARLEPSLCPHAKNDHEVCRALEHDRCPICGSVVGVEKDKTQATQLALI